MTGRPAPSGEAPGPHPPSGGRSRCARRRPGAGSARIPGAGATLLVVAALLAASPASSRGATGEAPYRGAASSPEAPELARCEASVADHMEAVYAEWRGLMERRGSLSETAFRERADSLLARELALEAMGARVLGDRWPGLDEHRRGEVTDALVHFSRTRLVAALTDADGNAEPDLSALFADDGGLRAEYRLPGVSGVGAVRLHFAPAGGGSCGIVDVEVDGRSMVDAARARALPALDEYSFPSMIAELGDYGYVVLEDFEDDSRGSLPDGWDWRDQDADKNKPYEVRSEDGNRYLAARDEGESVILGKEMEWSLSEYPYVSFRVRVHEIPPGGDERYDDRVDSAAGVYFTYRRKMLGLIPESVKYVWSSTLPVGAAAKRGGVGRPWQVVFGSGEEGLGEWRTYTFDLRQAYRDTFGGEPPSTPIGVGVLSDANSVGGTAYADYDEIRALRTAPAGVGSGVKEVLCSECPAN